MADPTEGRTAAPRLLAWDPCEKALVPCRADRAGVEVVDSWLVDAGRARGVSLHLDRFAAACRERCGLDVLSLRRMLSAAVDAIPGEGRWFPRVECARVAAGHELRLRLRPAPPVAGSPVTVWVPDEPDPRTCPRVKGPDLALQEAMRVRAHRHGGDEALLRDREGHVLEGAFTGLIWWRDDTLCLPDGDLPVLPSVTATLLTGLAHADGQTVRRERVRVERLAGLEVWVVNALHGIRPVSAWSGAAVEPGCCRRACSWQARLEALQGPLR